MWSSKVRWCKPQGTLKEKGVNFCPIIREVLNKVEEFDELYELWSTIFLPLWIFFAFLLTSVVKLLLFVVPTPKQMRNVCHYALGA